MAIRTLLLSRSETVEFLDPHSIVGPLREAFVACSTAKHERARRVRAGLGGRGTSTVLFPGSAPGAPAYTVKVHAKFPDQDPAIRGVACLHDTESGALLAIMDSSHLTAVRTGLAGALAAHVLSRPDAGTAAAIGAGVQGAQQLRSRAALRPLSSARLFDTVAGKAEAFSRRLGGEMGFPIEAAPCVEEAVANADVIFSATWAREPFLERGMLPPGLHVTTLGPDEPGKGEFSAEVIRSSLFVCDDRALAVEMGALGGVGLGEDAVAAELGDVLGGLHPGRTSRDQITVFGGVRIAFQDAVPAWSL